MQRLHLTSTAPSYGAPARPRQAPADYVHRNMPSTPNPSPLPNIKTALPPAQPHGQRTQLYEIFPFPHDIDDL
ncbi:hypothetical protein GCM10010326_54830 [Streptomyces xanthochromogenes]|uniref:Uncharacterized protein n=1 Tax=Streptomyces xanthochromogenes TaxID=67384 RepID=A0ABQ3AIE9_9ACTN|nr:hypothetical protein GCM10010326_54830 [Streptomyces xanthochromogenes]